MNAMMFGRAPRSLFGVYQPPRTPKARSAGIVLCYPFGQEYMRAHRAFRQLALLLSGTGFHVLRFDYSGTGDSAGDGDATALSQWTSDVGTAADELRETADVDRIAFVGLRLGAAVAALAAAGRRDVDAVVLWDPIVHGAAYVDELTAQEDVAFAHSPAVGTVGVLGFPLTMQMRAELLALDLRTVAAPLGSGRLVVTSADAPEMAALCPVSPVNTYAVVPSDGSWHGVDEFGGALIPVAQIGRIVAYLGEAIP